jgi:hypothetical protein
VTNSLFDFSKLDKSPGGSHSFPLITQSLIKPPFIVQWNLFTKIQETTTILIVLGLKSWLAD